ncbi:MAG: DegT/DnrJ/EryC1/StrS family aminotransferase, partial [Candidatus Omnitrophota bacterium]
SGSIGDIGCFSFYPSKNLGGMGDGGMISTCDPKIYARLLKLRDYGRVSRYEHHVIGYNSRLDTLQAAILRLKLKKLNRWNEMRREAAGIYNRLLRDAKVITPYASFKAEHVYHVYAIRAKKRMNVYNKLSEKGITAIIHYPIPLHLQKVYKGLGYRKGDFPVAEKVSQEIISLPMYPHLKERQIRLVTDTVKEAI